MQITLTQYEIEQAIKRYIDSKLTVANGNQMVIEFGTTRSPFTVTALVDIQPSNGSEGNTRTASVGAQVTQTTHVTEPSAPVVEPKPEPEVQVVTEAPRETQEAEIAVDKPQEVETQPVTFDNAQTSASGGGRSLFKGLSRPKNTAS